VLVLITRQKSLSDYFSEMFEVAQEAVNSSEIVILVVHHDNHLLFACLGCRRVSKQVASIFKKEFSF